MKLFAHIITKNIIWQIVGKFGASLSALGITILIAQSLGSSMYGDYIKVTSFVTIFFLFVDFGLNAVVVRGSSKNTFSVLRQDVLSLLFLRFLIGIFCMVVILVVMIVIPKESAYGYPITIRPFILLFSIVLVLQGCIISSNAVFQSVLLYQYQAISIIIGWISGLGFVYMYSVQQQLTLEYAVLGMLIAYGIQTLISMVFVKLLVVSFAPVEWGRVRQLFFSSLPLGLLLIINVIYARSDQIIMAFTRPSWELGVYGYAYKYFDFLLTLPTFFVNAMFPGFIKKFSQGSTVFHTHILRYSYMTFGISIFIFIASYLFAPLLSISGRGFIESIFAFRILILGLPFFFLSNIFLWGLLVDKTPKRLFWLYGGVCIGTILINSIGIPLYGYVFAATTTVLSEGVVCMVLGVWIYQK
jgi:O-antigen/teichoic acid export membrane protein